MVSLCTTCFIFYSSPPSRLRPWLPRCVIVNLPLIGFSCVPLPHLYMVLVSLCLVRVCLVLSCQVFHPVFLGLWFHSCDSLVFDPLQVILCRTFHPSIERVNLYFLILPVSMFIYTLNILLENAFCKISFWLLKSLFCYPLVLLVVHLSPPILCQRCLETKLDSANLKQLKTALSAHEHDHETQLSSISHFKGIFQPQSLLKLTTWPDHFTKYSLTSGLYLHWLLLLSILLLPPFGFPGKVFRGLTQLQNFLHFRHNLSAFKSDWAKVAFTVSHWTAEAPHGLLPNSPGNQTRASHSKTLKKTWAKNSWSLLTWPEKPIRPSSRSISTTAK